MLEKENSEFKTWRVLIWEYLAQKCNHFSFVSSSTMFGWSYTSLHDNKQICLEEFYRNFGRNIAISEFRLLKKSSKFVSKSKHKRKYLKYHLYPENCRLSKQANFLITDWWQLSCKIDSDKMPYTSGLVPNYTHLSKVGTSSLCNG